jgi:nitroimidazol reductase NimA-like FMN-containing flavoprotein (pyridoxamine 5'-phosphate oxidase superfamily)
MADHAPVARTVLDSNSFMTLATADADGVPWASPVWFAQENYRELYWVSAPDSRHSRNLAVRPELSIVVFDSTQTPGDVQAVYMSATARQPDDVETEIGVYSRVSARSGLPGWGVERVTGAARLRLYKATVTEHYIMNPDAPVDARLAVTP